MDEHNDCGIELADQRCGCPDRYYFIRRRLSDTHTHYIVPFGTWFLVVDSVELSELDCRLFVLHIHTNRTISSIIISPFRATYLAAFSRVAHPMPVTSLQIHDYALTSFNLPSPNAHGRI